jgi:hypothetical protein
MSVHTFESQGRVQGDRIKRTGSLREEGQEMDALKTVADYFLKLSTFVSSVQENILRREAEQRKLASEFLHRVADLLDKIIEKLESDDEPIAECAQLNTLMYSFPEFIRAFGAQQDRENLAALVSAAHDSPVSAVKWLRDKKRLVLPCEDLPVTMSGLSPGRYEEEIVKLKEAAGIFRAVAMIVGVGLESMGMLGPSEERSRKKRLMRILKWAGAFAVVLLGYFMKKVYF